MVALDAAEADPDPDAHAAYRAACRAAYRAVLPEEDHDARHAVYHVRHAAHPAVQRAAHPEEDPVQE